MEKEKLKKIRVSEDNKEKNSGGNWKSKLTKEPWKGLRKERDRQQYIQTFEGEEKWKDSYL